jgi:serine/threonine protein kinase
MSNNTLAHPGPEQLSAFGLGRLDPAEADEVERHVQSCTVCCQTLWSLPEDQLVSLLRSAFPKPPDSGAPPPASEVTSAFPSVASEGPPLPPELAEHSRYRIVEVLGQGGMGTVYKAQHRLMERVVALKMIDRGLTGNPAVVERFRREVKTAAQLNHPNIVHAYDAEQVGDSHFLVMEFVEGTTLARLVEQQGPLSVAQACDDVRQAALGLQRAFENGMVHRDIKPQNLMRTPGGVVKILDFGLARLMSDNSPSLAAPVSESVTENASPACLTQTGMVMGTADYMAPEQIDDPHAADIRADIYSLGCTLYFLLAGRAPFPEGTILQKLRAHRTHQPRPLSDFRKDVPPALVRVLERMMAKDPAQRYQTPAEVAEALTPFVAALRRPRRLQLAGVLSLLAAVLMWSAVIYNRIDWGQTVIDHAGVPQNTATNHLRIFDASDKPITHDGVSVDKDGWRIEAKEPRIFRLFEVANLNIEDCRVLYRAQLKCENLKGKAYLEMWCRFPDGEEAFSKDVLHPLSGTTDWSSFQTPFFVQKGERVDLIKLNVAIEGTGTIWIKDISLRKTPLPAVK